MSKTRLAVLMGGRSSERAVSLSTGRMILEAIDQSRYDAFPVDAALFGNEGRRVVEATGENEIAALSEAEAALERIGNIRSMTHLFAEPRPDVAFIALHGRFGEDGTVQGMLELLGIPYTGSGVLASALAMDKVMAKRTLQCAGVPVPPSVDVFSACELGQDLSKKVQDQAGYPVIVKPSRQGSTIGMTKVDSPERLAPAIETALIYDNQVLIEKFITGAEITVPILGNDDLQVLPIVEIVPKGGFYDYKSKYTPGATQEIVPARIPGDVAEEARRLALACHKALGCRGMSRTDMIVSLDGLYVLEVNTIPGMTPTSLLPLSANAAGISFPDLLDKLITLALEG